ncbi:MAG: DUF72 domain-containing protein [Halomonas sp.]|uniref:DUF72 domain-containing protein n=1 Tax=Halomonas sp. TaxID=1486246 RepID=UPI003F92EFB2
MLHLGLPMWANTAWRGGLYPPHDDGSGHLADYARVFNAVEGNTTFYSGVPLATSVDAWARQAPSHFRFCFKLPAELTHERRLVDIEAPFDSFIAALAPLRDRLGPLMVQLPRDLGEEALPRLGRLLARWPADIGCAVEPRHIDFFHKGRIERDFNRLLITHGANRVMLDVRPLFSGQVGDHGGMIQARKEKPKRPLHVISTGANPVIRFIGHVDESVNHDYLSPWIKQLALWVKQGKTPFFFVHTADNRAAPALARLLHERLADVLDLPALADFAGHRQPSLF